MCSSGARPSLEISKIRVHFCRSFDVSAHAEMAVAAPCLCAPRVRAFMQTCRCVQVSLRRGPGAFNNGMYASGALGCDCPGHASASFIVPWADIALKACVCCISGAARQRSVNALKSRSAAPSELRQSKSCELDPDLLQLLPSAFFLRCE